MRDIKEYLEITSSSGGKFSADGKTVYFASNRSGTTQVYQTTPQGEKADGSRILTEGERITLLAPTPSGKNCILIGSDYGGNEKNQFFILENGERTPITKGFEQCVHSFSSWNDEGTKIVFSANREHEGLFDLYVYDVKEQATTRIGEQKEPGYMENFLFSPDEKQLVGVYAINSFYMHIIKINVETGERTQLTQTESQYNIVRILNEKTALINTDLDRDFIYVAALNLETGNITPLMKKNDRSVALVARGHDRNTYIISERYQTSNTLYLYNHASGHKQKLPFDGPQVLGLSFATAFSPDDTQVLFTRTTPTDIADVWLWDTSADTVKKITESSYGDIDKEEFVPMEHHTTTSFDGETIPLWYIPPTYANGPAPVIIDVHGGPEADFDPAFGWLPQALVKRGYAFVAPNVRGSSGYGRRFTTLDDVDKRMDSVRDLDAIHKWIEEQEELDASRCIIMGGSYGGFMVLAAITEHPDRYIAAYDCVGITNFVTFLEQTSPYRREAREKEYGSLERDREFLESVSPIHKADKIRTPLFISHGANDSRVPLFEAEQIAQAMKENGVPYELAVYHDEGHGIHKKINKLDLWPRFMAFLEEHVEQ